MQRTGEPFRSNYLSLPSGATDACHGLKSQVCETFTTCAQFWLTKLIPCKLEKQLSNKINFVMKVLLTHHFCATFGMGDHNMLETIMKTIHWTSVWKMSTRPAWCHTTSQATASFCQQSTLDYNTYLKQLSSFHAQDSAKSCTRGASTTLTGQATRQVLNTLSSWSECLVSWVHGATQHWTRRARALVCVRLQCNIKDKLWRIIES